MKMPIASCGMDNSPSVFEYLHLVKKYLLFLLSLAVFFLAQGRESNSISERIPGAHCLSKNSSPNRELHLLGQYTTAVPLYRAFKKITDGSESPSTVLIDFASHVIVDQKTINSLYSKSYLAHIHPSHHFW